MDGHELSRTMIPRFERYLIGKLASVISEKYKSIHTNSQRGLSVWNFLYPALVHI